MSNNRRRFLKASVAGILGSGRAARSQSSSSRRPVLQQGLPQVTMDGWQVTAVEITHQPGAGSSKHRHPGFVLGYVLEGELRFQVEGQPEAVIPAGEMFYDPPAGLHAVSWSGS